jgi:hypothetical protein
MFEEATRSDQHPIGDALKIQDLMNRALMSMSCLSSEETIKDLMDKQAGTPEHIYLAVKAAEILVKDFG